MYILFIPYASGGSDLFISPELTLEGLGRILLRYEANPAMFFVGASAYVLATPQLILAATMHVTTAMILV